MPRAILPADFFRAAVHLADLCADAHEQVREALAPAGGRLEVGAREQTTPDRMAIHGLDVQPCCLARAANGPVDALGADVDPPA